MLVYEAVGGLILTQCPDRRQRERLEHREPAEINGRRATTRDISPRGLSIDTVARVVPGQIVSLTLGCGTGQPAEFSTQARVVRVQPDRGRSIVGLEFLE